MLLSEELAREKNKVLVISQSDGLLDALESESRGKDVKFKAIFKIDSSRTNLVLRMLSSLLFASWVFVNLIFYRPRHIYIATDPPIIVPFIVSVLSKIIKSDYIYHYQDIHPEILNHYKKLPIRIFNFFKKVDCYSQVNAKHLITITNQMKIYLESRSNNSNQITLLTNPTNLEFASENISEKRNGFIFCGNAGRFQRIPLLMSAIEEYFAQDGKLEFCFIGDGIYAEEIRLLSEKYDQIDYLGYLPADECNKITAKYKWALLPIEDGILNYCFPSKTSAYIACGCKILSIASSGSSIDQWIDVHSYGENVSPNVDKLVEMFFRIEMQIKSLDDNNLRLSDKEVYSPKKFAASIKECLTMMSN